MAKQTQQKPRQEDQANDPAEPPENNGTQPPTPPEAPVAPVVPEEVSALTSAVARIRQKITYHEEQIAEHMDSIQQLRTALAEQLGVLASPANVPAVEDEETGRNLIINFLKGKGGRASNTDIATFYRDAGRKSNASVELSRMIKAGILKRPGRGIYELVKK